MRSLRTGRRLVCALSAAWCVVWGHTTAAGAGETTKREIAEIFRSASAAVITLRATYTKKVGDTQQQAVQGHLGIIVSEDGLVLFPGSGITLVDTVSNVVAEVGASQVSARYVGHAKGVAFARLEPEKQTKFPFIQFDPGRKVEIGDEVVAIGTMGSAYNNARTVTTSRVAAVVTTPVELYVFGRRDVLQGAPVFTLDGKAIGVIGIDEQFYAIAVRHPNRQQALEALLSQPTVLPAGVIAPLVKAPPRSAPDDYARRGWVGAALEVLSPDVAAELGIKERRGVYVSCVVPNSAMSRSGLEQCDVILSWEGRPAAAQTAAELLEFRRAIEDSKPGTKVEFEVFRGGKTLRLRTEIEKTPPGYEQSAASTMALLALAVKPLTYDVRLSYRIDWDSPGVIVSWVSPGGPGGLAGVSVLDVIKEIDGTPVKDPGALKSGLEAAQKEKKAEVVLLVGKERNTKTTLVRVRVSR